MQQQGWTTLRPFIAFKQRLGRFSGPKIKISAAAIQLQLKHGAAQHTTYIPTWHGCWLIFRRARKFLLLIFDFDTMLPTSMSAPVLVDKQAVLSAAEPALPSVPSQGSVPDYWYSSTAPASPAHGTLYQRLSYVDDHSTASPLPPSLGLPQSQADSWTDCLSASQSPSRFWAEYVLSLIFFSLVSFSHILSSFFFFFLF